MAAVEIVRYGTFYEGLTESSLKGFMELSTNRRYSQGQMLYREGDMGGFVVLILSGAVALTSRTATGAETLLDIRSAGDLVGEREVLDGINQKTFSRTGTSSPRSSQARALSPVSARFIRGKDFSELVRDHSEIWQLVTRDLQVRLTDAEKRLSQAAGENANQRLARALLEMPTRRGQRINDQRHEIPLSQDELASWIGSSRGTVERILRNWRDRKVIVTMHRSILVVDPEKLAMISGLRGTRRSPAPIRRGHASVSRGNAAASA
ncbi:Crp/Fnr family transcriptional regulator [Nocardiopsis ganjiahuensis]|uniref:Crp/Fnr family transcriptional regulator n=1 Tax=Nocardiopsis ganjiahuensis TaxID=239984 RepID=UPI000A00188A|nr:Crp/Fnr family transcriptional regulator [Nocardiopsis ganjiahuensis]